MYPAANYGARGDDNKADIYFPETSEDLDALRRGSRTPQPRGYNEETVETPSKSRRKRNVQAVMVPSYSPMTMEQVGGVVEWCCGVAIHPFYLSKQVAEYPNANCGLNKGCQLTCLCTAVNAFYQCTVSTPRRLKRISRPQNSRSKMVETKTSNSLARTSSSRV